MTEKSSPENDPRHDAPSPCPLDLASRFVHDFSAAPPGGFDELLARTLADLGGFTGADRVFFVLIPDHGGHSASTREWIRPGSDLRPMDEFDPGRMAWLTARLSEQRLMEEADVQNFSGAAQAEQKYFRGSGTGRLLLAPLLPRLGHRGFVAVVGGEERADGQEQKLLLRMVTDLISANMDRLSAQSELERSREKFQVVVESSPVGVFQSTVDGEILSVNPAFAQDYGYRSPEEFLARFGSNAYAFYADPARRDELVAELRKNGVVTDFLIHGVKRDGSKFWASLSARLKEKDGREYLEGFLIDITERMKARQRLEATLAEKEVLLKEVHHRVKNNLQVISSLLNLQDGMTDDPAAAEALRKSRDRIRTMAMVHEELYRSDDLASIRLDIYLNKLVNKLASSCPRPSGARFLVQADELACSPDVAIPCGLMVNELVTNSIKHGLGGPDAEIRVSLTLSGDEACLLVADNGPGFSDRDEDPLDQAGLGLSLVQSLTAQLDGEIEMRGDAANGKGFSAEICFPLKGRAARREP